MLGIRSDQLHILAVDPRAEFIRRVCEHVQSVFPEKTQRLGTERTRNLVEYGAGRARVYGLRSERSVTLFVDLLLGLGEDFERMPECVPLQLILEEEGTAEDAKLYRVYRKIPEIERDIRANRGDSA